MTRFRTSLVILLALLWAPVTSHCMLEQLPGMEFLSCCTHEAGQCGDKEKDCEGDSCAVIEQALYKLQEDIFIVPKSQTAAEFLFDAILSEAVIDSGGEGVQPAPPPSPLKSTWQFVYRAALPVRAPSVLA